MQTLAGSWTEITSGEMVEIRKHPGPDSLYQFNFFLSGESYTVHAETQNLISGRLTGLTRYLKSDPDERLYFDIVKDSLLQVRSSDKKPLATFRSNAGE